MADSYVNWPTRKRRFDLVSFFSACMHVYADKYRDQLQPLRVMSIGITTKDKDHFVVHQLIVPEPWVEEVEVNHRALEVEDMNINIVYPTANMKHTKLMARTRQLSLLEEAESIPKIKSHTLGTRCGVPRICYRLPNPWMPCNEGWRRSETLDTAQPKPS